MLNHFRRKLFSIIILLGFILVGFTACDKDDIPVLPEEPSQDENTSGSLTPDDDNMGSDPDDPGVSTDPEEENPDNEDDNQENNNPQNPVEPDPEPYPTPDYGFEYAYLTNLEVFSEIDLKRWRYDILLPPSYDFEGDLVYPVLFLLHGYDYDKACWVSDFNLKNLLEDFQEKELIKEMIIVMPFADNTYYIDGFQNGWNYESFFFQEFIPNLKENYRLSESSEDWWIAGFSMGGYGAARYASRYPEIFSFCYAMSAPLDGRGSKATVEEVFTYEILSNASDLPYFVFDVGNRDSFMKVNQTVDKLLNNYGIAHELIVSSGGHDGYFWTKSLTNLFDRLPQGY